MKAFKISL